MQMKRILGILLALCFLMSVTAAAVGASGNVNYRENNFKNFEERHKEDHFKKHNDFRFNEHGKKKHFHPGHWTNEKRGHREFRNNRYIVVYKIVKVYKIGYWSEY